MPDSRRKARPRSAPRAAARRKGEFAMPRTVSHRALLTGESDESFRQTVYLMVLAIGRLQTCREAFGRTLGLTGSQFAVLIGTAYRQKRDGVSIRALAEHIQLAATHVTTEVGRLVRKGLLIKRLNTQDRRGVLVSLSPKGEDALIGLAPFLRRINDLLFHDISRASFAALSQFLIQFALNTEHALAEIAHSEAARGRGRSRTARRSRNGAGRTRSAEVRAGRNAARPG